MPNSNHVFIISLIPYPGEQGVFVSEVTPGGVADRAGVNTNDRLVEVNGENIESYTHEQVVDKVKMAGGSLMFLMVDEETDRYYCSMNMKIRAQFATTKCLPHEPRIVNLTKAPGGYGFLLKEEAKIGGRCIAFSRRRGNQ